MTVTYDGEVYLGIDPTSTTELTKKVKSALSNRADNTLYVKADARTAYRNLVVILDSVGTAGVERDGLLGIPYHPEDDGIDAHGHGIASQCGFSSHWPRARVGRHKG